MHGAIFLIISIVFEVVGTTFLKLSDGFTNIVPIILLIVFYGLSFTFFVFALRTISLSVGYSIWSGLGTAGAALIGVLIFNEVISGVNIIGLLIIIAGIVLMNMDQASEEEDKEVSLS